MVQPLLWRRIQGGFLSFLGRGILKNWSGQIRQFLQRLVGTQHQPRCSPRKQSKAGWDPCFPC